MIPTKGKKQKRAVSDGEPVRKLNLMQYQPQDIGKKVRKLYNMEYAGTKKPEFSDSLWGVCGTSKKSCGGV